MLDLPPKILKTIFQYLKKKDLRTCYFVCKSWCLIAIPLNWKEVTLRDHNIALVKTLLNNSDNNQYFKYSHHIKKLTINDSIYSRNQYKFNKSELLELLNQLSNINEIEFSTTNCFGGYLGYLLDADMPHIKKINYTECYRPSYSCDLSFLVNYTFRATITSVDLLYNKSIIHLYSQQINILDSLTEFKQLTELRLFNTHDINLTPFYLQYNCPNLKRLTFDSSFPISESAMLCLLDNNSRTNLNFLASLSHLQLQLPSLSAMYTRYLVDYFPDQLCNFSISISDQNISNWIDIVGIELALIFMKKAGSIEETSIRFHRGYQYQEQVDNFEEIETTIFFKLLNEFRRTQQTYCEASFLGCYHDPDISASCSFSYTDNGKLFVGYDKYYGFPPSLNLPDKTSSVIGPEIFNALRFVIPEADDTILPVLDYCLSNCPELQSLYIGYNEDPLDDSCDGLFGFSLHCKDLISSDPTNRNINYLKIIFIDPVQSYFDLVTAHLHDIEVVSLEPSKWGSTYHDSVLDLTGFKKLKTFKCIATIHDSEKKDNDFILFRYTNGEEQRYYLDKEKSRNLQVDSCQNPNTPSLTVYCDASVAFDSSELTFTSYFIQ